MTPFHRPAHLLCLCLVLATLGACRTVATIAQLNDQGRPADGRRVTITAQVADLAGRSPSGQFWYEIEEDGARIWVESNHPCPARGDRLRIEGRVGSAFTAYTNSGRPGVEFGKQWSGLVIEETRRDLLNPPSPSQQP